MLPCAGIISLLRCTSAYFIRSGAQLELCSDLDATDENECLSPVTIAIPAYDICEQRRTPDTQDLDMSTTKNFRVRYVAICTEGSEAPKLAACWYQ